MKTYTVKVNDKGTTRWYCNDQLHRENGPAVEYDNGSKAWYRHGKPHREDGPAIEYAHGSKEWYLNGKLHREDGPAIEYFTGFKLWWLNGNRLTEAEFLEKTKKVEGREVEIDGVKYRLTAV